MSETALPKGWLDSSIGEVFDVLDSMRVPINAAERSRRPGPVPYYGATGQVGWIDDSLFDEPLVLLGEDGAPFLQPRPKAYVIRGRAWVNNHAHVLRPRGGMPEGFWKYQLDQLDYAPFVTGTTRLKLSQAPMRRIPVLVPPKGEQHRIVSALDSYSSRLDAAEAALQRVEANLKRYRASVLKAAVEGRLVPTEAELSRKEGRGYEPASVLLDRILLERRRKCEEAELAKMVAKGKPPANDKWKAKYKEPTPPDTQGLPELPEGWCWATLDQVSDRITKGSTPTTAGHEYTSSGVRFVRVECLRSRAVDHTLPATFIGADAHHSQVRSQLQAGDLLFSIAGTLGRVAEVRAVDLPANTNQALAIVRGATLRLVGSYLLTVLESRYGQKVVRDRGRGGAMQNLSLADVASIAVPLAPIAEQRRVVVAVDRHVSLHEDAISTVHVASRRISRLRQSILKWAFEGRLVDQDPTDEPASVLLERIRAEREAAAAKPKAKRATRQRKAKS